MNRHLNLRPGVALILIAALAWLLPMPAVAALSVQGTLREAGPTSTDPARGGDAVIYRQYSGAASLVADFDHPRRASAFDVAGAGPAARVTGVDTFIVSRNRQVYDRIRVSLQFWNRHTGQGNAVFADAPIGGLIHIDLTGPFILEAGTPYEVTADLVKPVQIEDFQAVGVSAQVVANTNGGQIIEHAGLAIAYDAGSEAAIGVPLVHYHGAAIGVGAFNFQDDEVTARPLAIALRGVSTSHVQCTAWPDTVNHLAEEFTSGDNGIVQRWSLNQNGGGPLLQRNGQLSMNTAQPSTTFPFVVTRGQPIPPSGEFSVRWLSRYTQTAGAGTGTLVLARGMPVNGIGDGSSQRVLENWQHNSGATGFRVRAWTPEVNDLIVLPPGNTDLHDIEYCWLSDRIEIWVDGVRQLQMSNEGLTRPDTLWSGNPVAVGAASAWSHFDLFSVRVRKPFSDQIFGNGFD